MTVSPEAAELLARFSHPRDPRRVAREYPTYEPRSVLRTIRELERAGLLVGKDDGGASPRLDAWRGCVASAQYHAASRNLSYLRSAPAVRKLLTRRASEERPPKALKKYAKAPRKQLPPSARLSRDAEGLRAVLDARRTVRRFSRRPVEVSQLAALVRGTFGVTGWIDAGPLGTLPVKTSPSGGSRHPVEAYVVAWNVRGLAPGLYHYDAKGDALERLAAGRFDREMVACASGQAFVGQAAFVCVLTAVFDRTLWKYRSENAYKVVLLDAGHLAQTFCLLATSVGLGPFTTAAIQESRLERLLGIDGVREFAVYLCGAGVPHAKSSRERSAGRDPLAESFE